MQKNAHKFCIHLLLFATYISFYRPKCYHEKLYNYGKTCIQNFWDYPNVIAGVVGNEVMNDLDAWSSAPCLKAYLDDLARYGKSLGSSSDSGGDVGRKTLPLIYATQHDSPSAEQLPDEAIKLTLDYLSCISSNGSHGDTNEEEEEMGNNNNILDNTFIFGINIESWCSSLQTFEYEEDGIEESSYHSLWKILSNGTKTQITMDAVSGKMLVRDVPTISPYPVTIPVVFTELGCSKILFNRDNNVQPKLVRDWKQIHVVTEEGQMSDVISGFVAYGYDGGGNIAFRMMGGDEVWDGVMPLPSSLDYDNFRTELSKVVTEEEGDRTDNDVDTIYNNSKGRMRGTEQQQSSCKKISTKLEKLWDVKLYPIEDMPSYYSPPQSKARSSIPIQSVNALFVRDLNTLSVSSSSLPSMILLVVLCSVIIVKYWMMKDGTYRRRQQYQQL